MNNVDYMLEEAIMYETKIIWCGLQMMKVILQFPNQSKSPVPTAISRLFLLLAVNSCHRICTRSAVEVLLQKQWIVSSHDEAMGENTANHGGCQWPYLWLSTSYHMVQTKANKACNRRQASNLDYIIFPQRELNLKLIHNALHLNN